MIQWPRRPRPSSERSAAPSEPPARRWPPKPVSLGGAAVVAIAAVIVLGVAYGASNRSDLPQFAQGGSDDPPGVRGAGNGDSQSDESIEGQLLPDLETSEPEVIYIEEADGARKLRFSTAVSNTGEGPMALVGVPGINGSVQAVQIIDTEDGGTFARSAGEFMPDPLHGHWHLRAFAQFELWRYRPDGRLESLRTMTSAGTLWARSTMLARLAGTKRRLRIAGMLATG